MDDSKSATLARMEQAMMSTPLGVDLARAKNLPKHDDVVPSGPHDVLTMRWPGLLFGVGSLTGIGVVSKVLPRFKITMPSTGHKFLLCFCFGMIGFLCGVKVNDHLYYLRLKKQRQMLRQAGLQTHFMDDEIIQRKEEVEREQREAMQQLDIMETWSEAFARLTRKEAPLGMDHRGRTPA